MRQRPQGHTLARVAGGAWLPPAGGRRLLGLATHRRPQGSAHGPLITAAASCVLISVGVAAHKSEQCDVVDVGALLLIEPHLARNGKREMASSQGLAFWLAHADIGAN